jgi:tetratricopeptide (TPR) repeat protein
VSDRTAAGRRLRPRHALAAALMAAALLQPPATRAHGDLDGQIEGVSARLRAEPRNAGLLLRRAELLRQHEQYARAARDYDAAEAVDPRLPGIALGRGQMLRATGALGPAEAELDRFLAMVPRSIEGRVARARTRAARADWSGAAADYSVAIDIAGTSPEPEHLVERARALQRAGDVDGAIAGLDAGMAIVGDAPTLGLLAIELEGERGRWDEALRRLDALRAKATRQETWLERRGDLLARAGRSAEAGDAWREAIAAITRLPPQHRDTAAMRTLSARLSDKIGQAPGPAAAP